MRGLPSCSLWPQSRLSSEIKPCVHSGAIHCSLCNLYQIVKVINTCQLSCIHSHLGVFLFLITTRPGTSIYLLHNNLIVHNNLIIHNNLIVHTFELRMFFKCHDLLCPSWSHKSQPRQIQLGQRHSSRSSS